ncbi:TlpA family protein disulfide reductase [Salibacteraceae bacterium]|nr:TlpA family protein disulfide reductase [Salibacteraceae bacterium]MDB9708936.1 TlpA family protein disulfide reductase [Salibacteraceae bacterium]
MKNLIFFSLMAVFFFTGFPKWVNIQFTRLNLESPDEIVKIESSQPSLYDHQILIENHEGEQIQLSDFEGGAVFISLWASWCVPCIAEFSSLEVLAKEIPDISIVALNIEDQETFNSFLDKNDYNLPFYLLRTPLPSQLNAPAIPATFILNEEGKVIFKHFGAVDWSSESTIAKLNKILI